MRRRPHPRAEGESRAILQVFDAIHEGDADSKLLAYQYLQMLPEIAKTESNKVWFVPTEFTGALKAVAAGFGGGEEPEPLKRSPKRKSTAQKSALGDAGGGARRGQGGAQERDGRRRDVRSHERQAVRPRGRKGHEVARMTRRPRGRPRGRGAFWGRMVR